MEKRHCWLKLKENDIFYVYYETELRLSYLNCQPKPSGSDNCLNLPQDLQPMQLKTTNTDTRYFNSVQFNFCWGSWVEMTVLQICWLKKSSGRDEAWLDNSAVPAHGLKKKNSLQLPDPHPLPNLHPPCMPCAYTVGAYWAGDVEWVTTARYVFGPYPR